VASYVVLIVRDNAVVPKQKAATLAVPALAVLLFKPLAFQHLLKVATVVARPLLLLKVAAAAVAGPSSRALPRQPLAKNPPP